MIVLQTKDRYISPECEVLEIKSEGIMAISPSDLGTDTY